MLLPTCSGFSLVNQDKEHVLYEQTDLFACLGDVVADRFDGAGHAPCHAVGTDKLLKGQRRQILLNAAQVTLVRHRLIATYCTSPGACIARQLRGLQTSQAFLILQFKVRSGNIAENVRLITLSMMRAEQHFDLVTARCKGHSASGGLPVAAYFSLSWCWGWCEASSL